MLQLQKEKIAAPCLREDFFKSTEQYDIIFWGSILSGTTVQILLTTSELFFTPRTPPSLIVPIGGHSRLPQSKLLQLLQKSKILACHDVQRPCRGNEGSKILACYW